MTDAGGRTRICAAVIGVGSLGQHHARILAAHPAARLAAVVDQDERRARKIAEPLGVPALTDITHLPADVQAAVVAVPTPGHAPVARILLERGIHVLVEKPFTSTVAEAEELIKLARDRDRVLQVGHVERFNPAVIAAQAYINEPRFIEVNRLGPYDPRTAHIGVVLDLMIHDLDIVLTLVRRKVASLEAHGARILSDRDDIAKVRLRFEGGCVADLSASRLSLEKYRRIRIFQRESYVSVDYAGRSLKIYRRKDGPVRTLSDVDIIRPKLSSAEPLFHELDHFLSCVADGKAPMVSGQHGRDALELAQDIVRVMEF